jgi:carbonic anhydrase
VHGWVYDIQDGLLRDLGLCLTTQEELSAQFEATRAGG